MPKKLTTEEFVYKSKKIHGNTFDYSLLEYRGNQKKVKIICPVHGEFEIPACKHLQGRGCPYCSGYKVSNNDFVERAKKIHGNKYDYSKVDYQHMHEKVIIICPMHGEFKQTPDRHLVGGCDKCAREKWGKNKTLTNEEFIDRSNSIHEFKYDYSLVKYKHGHEKIKIICPIHGEFEQLPINHLSGKGCLSCGESKGEREVRKWLKENCVKYISQKKFKKCRNILPLPFDFYLPDYNICIEYDGIQHFKPISKFGGDIGYKTRVYNDKIKTNYCKENGIKLIRIKYSDDVILKLKSLKIV